jgi:hypothetical protein
MEITGKKPCRFILAYENKMYVRNIAERPENDFDPVFADDRHFVEIGLDNRVIFAVEHFAALRGKKPDRFFFLNKRNLFFVRVKAVVANHEIVF